MLIFAGKWLVTTIKNYFAIVTDGGNGGSGGFTEQEINEIWTGDGYYDDDGHFYSYDYEYLFDSYDEYLAERQYDIENYDQYDDDSDADYDYDIDG